MDLAVIAQATVTFLTPYFSEAAGKCVEDGLGVMRERFVNWLKGKFTKPAQASALEVAARAPGDAEALDALRYQIERALQLDESFRKDLLERLPKEALPPGIAQGINITGDGNVGIQNTGSGSNIVVEK
jgi:hypothetical protein